MSSKYYNSIVEKEIQEKGFSVYNYISIKELLLTLRKDYLDILSKINIPFGIITIILGIISYAHSNYLLPFLFLMISYAIIFTILLCKLVKKTYVFLLISDVLYTQKGVVLGEKILYFNNPKEIEQHIATYEKIFLEYLGGQSRLADYISGKRKDLMSMKGNNKLLFQISKILKAIGKSRDGGDILAKIMIPAVISFIIYIIFMYSFYYIGYILGIIFVAIYTVCIHFILAFRNSTELKIKNQTRDIDDNISKMNHVYALLDLKFTEFKDGNISDISNVTQKGFDDFYTAIFMIYREKETLEQLIVNGKYKEFIDFHIFEKYLKNTFNKPIISMLLLLKKYKKLLEGSLKELKNMHGSLAEYTGHIKMKERILEQNLDILNANIIKLEKSLI